MSLNGVTPSFIPLSLNGLQTASFSNTDIGAATASSFQLTTATPSRLARFDANDFLVSSSIDQSDVIIGSVSADIPNSKNFIPKATNTNTLANSIIYQSGTVEIDIDGRLNVNNDLYSLGTYTSDGGIISNNNNQFNGSITVSPYATCNLSNIVNVGRFTTSMGSLSTAGLPTIAQPTGTLLGTSLTMSGGIANMWFSTATYRNIPYITTFTGMQTNDPSGCLIEVCQASVSGTTLTVLGGTFVNVPYNTPVPISLSYTPYSNPSYQGVVFFHIIGDVTYNVSWTSVSTVTNQVTITGDETMTGNLLLTGDETMTGNLTVTGNETLNGNLTINNAGIGVVNGSISVSNTNAYQTIGLNIANASGTPAKGVQLSIAGNTSSWASYGSFGIYNGSTTGSSAGFPLVIAPNGNIGFCQPNPSYALHCVNNLPLPTITTTGAFPAQFVLQSSSSWLKIGQYYTASVGDYGIIQSSDFYSGVEHPLNLNLQPLGGAVGIGTVNPIANLQVSQANAVGNGYGALVVDSPNSGVAGGTLTLRNSSGGNGAFASLIFELDGSTSCGTGSTPIAFAQGNGMLYSQITGTSNQTKMGFIQWNGSSEVETVTILPSGNLGINTTSPGYKLVVDNPVNNGYTSAFLSSTVAAGGNTGIIIGKTNTTSNAGHVVYTHVSNNSLENAIGLGTFGNYSPFAVFGSGKAGMNMIGNANNGYWKWGMIGDNGLASGPHVAYWTNDFYPVFQQLNWAHDNICLSFDGYFDGYWRASSGYTPFFMYKTGNQMIFAYGSTTGAGNATSQPAITSFSSSQIANSVVQTSSAQPYCLLYGSGVGPVAYGGGTIVWSGGAMLVGQSVGMTNVTGNGWDSTNARFYAPVSGRWQICISFYWNSFFAGSRFQLQGFNSSNANIWNRYCALNGAGISSDTTQNYSQTVYMTAGDWCRVVCTSGSGTLYMAGYDHTHISFAMIM